MREVRLFSKDGRWSATVTVHDPAVTAQLIVFDNRYYALIQGRFVDVGEPLVARAKVEPS